MNNENYYGNMNDRFQKEKKINKISLNTRRFARVMAATALSSSAIATGINSNTEKIEIMSLVPITMAAGYAQRKHAISSITKETEEYVTKKQYTMERMHGIEESGRVINKPIRSGAIEQSTFGKMFIQQTAASIIGVSLGAEITSKIPEHSLDSERIFTGLMVAVGCIALASDSHSTRMRTINEYMDTVDRSVDYHVMVQGAGFEPAKA